MSKRIGIFSFARYSPTFGNKNKNIEPTSQQRELLLRRSCKVISTALDTGLRMY